MTDHDVEALRVRLLDAAVSYSQLAHDARQFGDNATAEFYQRQYEQAMTGYRSLPTATDDGVEVIA